MPSVLKAEICDVCVCVCVFMCVAGAGGAAPVRKNVPD